MILMIDNYDSFTYNIVQYIEQCGKSVDTIYIDKVDTKDISLKYEAVVISPGAGIPTSLLTDIIKEIYKKMPILGICLGHQAIGASFGAKITQAKRILHGKSDLIFHNRLGIFKNVGFPFKAARYHSLVLDKETLPDDFDVTAESSDEEIMGIKHKKYPLIGVQFHPESIITENGIKIINNFITEYIGG